MRTLPTTLGTRRHFRRVRRASRRIAIAYAVVEGDERGASVAAFTLNIGVGGAFVETDDPPPPGSALMVDLPAPPHGQNISLHADVRWIADGDDDASHGMGIRFHGLDGRGLAALADYFGSLTPTLDVDEVP